MILKLIDQRSTALKPKLNDLFIALYSLKHFQMNRFFFQHSTLFSLLHVFFPQFPFRKEHELHDPLIQQP